MRSWWWWGAAWPGGGGRGGWRWAWSSPCTSLVPMQWVKNCHPSLAERNNEFCWVSDFLRERKSEIHSCIALQQRFTRWGRFKTDAVANSKRKFCKVVVVDVVIVLVVVAVVSWWVAWLWWWAKYDNSWMNVTIRSQFVFLISRLNSCSPFWTLGMWFTFSDIVSSGNFFSVQHLEASSTSKLEILLQGQEAQN